MLCLSICQSRELPLVQIKVFLKREKLKNYSFLFSKHFPQIERYSLVTVDINWNLLIAYDLYCMYSCTTLLMVYSETWRSFAIVLVDFLDLYRLFVEFNVQLHCVWTVLGLYVWVLHLAVDVSPISSLQQFSNYNSEGSGSFQEASNFYIAIVHFYGNY